MSYTIAPKSSVLMSTTNSGLTPEQIQRMEDNRLKALAKKAQAAGKNFENTNPSKINTIHTINSSKSSIFNNPSTVKPPSIFNNTSKINTIHNTAPVSTKSTSKSNNNLSTTKAPTPSEASSSGNPVSSNYGRCLPLEEDPENRFEIIIGYNKGIVELFKTIKGRKYDPNTKRWNFSRKQYDEILLQIKHQLNDTVKLEPLDRSSGKNFFLKFFLQSKTRFEAVSMHKPELNEIYKTIKSRDYNATEKKWSFDLSDYDTLVTSINAQLKGSVTIVPLPKSVKEIFKDQMSGKKLKAVESNIDLEHLKEYVDPTITKSLLAFQVESICFAIQQEGRLLLADDMGLGKTIQGLAIASYYRKEWPVFIVCPSSVKFMWKENAKRWISHSIRDVCDLDEDEEVDEFIQVMENARHKIHRKCKIVIASYELVAKNVENIMQNQYNMVIADECHLLKNIKAIRTRSTLKLLEGAKRVLLMSGTPALSRPSELFSQIQAINPTLFNNFHEFGIRYCDGKETKFGMDYSGYSNMNELRTLLEQKLLVRREKKDVMTQLPSKSRETVILNPALVELNSKTLKQAKKSSDATKQDGKANHGALLNYFQETARVKAKAVAEYILDLLENGKKFLVFAHHQVMLDMLQTELEENKHDFIRIDGATPSEQRTQLVEKFQTDENCLCALLSICAANSGITLTAASLVCFAELYWNPGILVQAEDRVYRIGQKNAVNIQYLCARGTADDDLWTMVKDKLDVLSKVGLTKESMIGTKESVMESSESDIANLNKFKELHDDEPEQKNKITNYTKEEKAKKKKEEKTKAPVNKPKTDSKNSKVSSDQTQQKIDQLLNGIDFGDDDAASPEIVCQKVKPTVGKKTTPPRKFSDVLDDDDDDIFLLNNVNLEAFEQPHSPAKKKKSIFKKK